MIPDRDSDIKPRFHKSKTRSQKHNEAGEVCEYFLHLISFFLEIIMYIVNIRCMSCLFRTRILMMMILTMMMRYQIGIFVSSARFCSVVTLGEHHVVMIYSYFREVFSCSARCFSQCFS